MVEGERSVSSLVVLVENELICLEEDNGKLSPLPVELSSPWREEAMLLRENRLEWLAPSGEGEARENERDFGIVRMTVGELGEGLLLRLPTGLDAGVPSRE